MGQQVGEGTGAWPRTLCARRSYCRVEKRAMRNYGRYTRGVAWLLKQCSGSALVCAIVLVSQYYPLCGEIDGKGLEYFITLCASMT